MKRRLDQLLVLLFAFGLAFPTLVSLGRSPQDKRLKEGRVLSSFPEWKDDANIWREYRQQWETYYGDHFGFRASLIAFDLWIKSSLFAETGPNVLAGSGGWFYLSRDCAVDTVNDCLGLTKIPQRRLKGLQRRLQERRDWLAAHGIMYLYVIAPNKETIYPEFLPGWLHPAATTKIDQFVNQMRLHSTVPVLDLRPALRQARLDHWVYYQTDSHWNLWGAFVAGETIIASQSKRMPGLTPLDPGAFTIQPAPGLDGDLVRMAGELGVKEANNPVFIPGPSLPGLEFSSSGTNAVGWPQIWRIPVAENQEITTIKNRQRTGRVVIFGDSYAVKLQPFLGYHFGTVILSRAPFTQDEVLRTQPVLVIDEVVERLLQ